ncbi:MAG: carbon-nitrogen hydrolase family protein [Actinobacteria bacterium]|nr:carbon-nitrogen hydrolase family protein [Actinomycetota bacterium]
MLLCTELWFTEHARSYARQGVELLAVPRATERGSLEQWTVAGRAAALLSGAFCVSSNRAGSTAGIDWAGGGFIIDPHGEVLALTTDVQPAVTCDIDLTAAARAKSTYPRTVPE